MLGLGYYPEISRTQNVGLGLWIRDLPDPKWLGLWYYPEISRTQNVGLGLGIRDFPDPKSQGYGTVPKFPGPKILDQGQGSEISRTKNVIITVLSRNFLDPKCWIIRVRDSKFLGPKMLGLWYYPEISWTKNVGLLGLGIRDFPDPKCYGYGTIPKFTGPKILVYQGQGSEISRIQNVRVTVLSRNFMD